MPYTMARLCHDNGGGHSEQKVKVGLDSPGNCVESRECLTYSLLHTCTNQDDLWTMSIDEMVFEFLWSITFFWWVVLVSVVLCCQKLKEAPQPGWALKLFLGKYEWWILCWLSVLDFRTALPGYLCEAWGVCSVFAGATACSWCGCREPGSPCYMWDGIFKNAGVLSPSGLCWKRSICMCDWNIN